VPAACCGVLKLSLAWAAAVLCRITPRPGYAFLPDRAPQGAPNVLVVLYDDHGLAAWSPFGVGSRCQRAIARDYEATRHREP
jgi:hypothetical protein